MRVHRSHQGMYDARAVNIGYTSDRDKHSPTYKKYIPEEEQIESVNNLFHRLIAHGGDLVALSHELENTPGYHFPRYKDPLSHSKCTLFHVPGGYRIHSIATLERILRNPVYIGTWKTGNKTYPNNHAAIVDKDIWNLTQSLLDKRKEEQRPIPREQSEACVLRSLLIKPFKGHKLSIITKNNAIRLLRKRHEHSMEHSKLKTFPLDVLVNLFKETFLEKLKNEKQCKEYAKAIILLHQRAYTNREHIQETYDKMTARYQKLYNTYIEANGPEPERAIKLAHAEMLEMEPEIKRLESVLGSKGQSLYPLKELELLLAAIKTHWNDLQVDTLNGLALLFCKGITPTPLSPRLWKIEIEWELWGKETWLGWTKKARHIWEPEEIEELRELVEQGIPKDQWMDHLPNQTRWGINTAFFKHLSSNLGYRKLYGIQPFHFKQYSDRIANLSINDQKVAKQYNIELHSIDLDENHLFFIEHTPPITPLVEGTENEGNGQETNGENSQETCEGDAQKAQRTREKGN